MFNSASEKLLTHTLYANCSVLYYTFITTRRENEVLLHVQSVTIRKKRRASSAMGSQLFLLGYCNRAILHLIGLYAKVLVCISMSTAQLLVILPSLLSSGNAPQGRWKVVCILQASFKKREKKKEKAF